MKSRFILNYQVNVMVMDIALDCDPSHEPERHGRHTNTQRSSGISLPKLKREEMKIMD